MQRPLVSVIVPAYNAEKTLTKCVESILGQSYDALEVLIVNDGSRDGTAALCDRFAARDRRVRVFHRQNSGVSATRNFGLSQAQGEFVQFVDSDDWLAEEATATMVQAAMTHDSDLVIADYYRVWDGAEQCKTRAGGSGPMDAQAFIHCFTESPSAFYYGVLWNKLYRREIISRFGLMMDETLSWCEDLLFNMRYYQHIANAYVLRMPAYHYVRSMTSLSMQKMNLFRLGRIRLKVFRAYRRFARETLPPRAYQAWKPRAVKFFYAGLIDEFVIPGGGKKKFGMRNA